MAGLQRLTGNCPAIQVVLPAPYIERLNALAQERGVTRSALIRAAIDTALFRGQGERRDVGSGEHTSADVEGQRQWRR
jgi:metal-responsive CopG/Arc/MetJ family transcriptional regulator